MLITKTKENKKFNRIKAISTLLLLITIAMVLHTIFKRSLWQNNVIDLCDAAENVAICRQKYIIGVLEKGSVKKAFLTIEQLKAHDPEFGAGCHGFTHTIGFGAYNTAIQGKNVYATPLSPCDYAYYHGLMMEVVMHGRSTTEEDFNFANNLCKKFVKLSKNNQDIYYQCYHGAGHGLPAYFYSKGTETLNDVMKESFNACDTYFEGEGKHFCKIGVYGGMAIYLTGGHGLSLKGFEMKDMFDMCAKAEDNIRPNCYEMMGPAVVSLVDNDINKAIYLINQNVKSDSDKLIMVNRTGQAITTYKMDASPQDVKQICDQVDGNSHFECIRGFMNGYVDEKVGDLKQSVLDFCNSGVFDDAEAAACRKGGLIE